jgi:hypothetical protein
LPRVVSPEEFDRAVEESGFIAQRTYSAPDQETLDAYRDQLYHGTWYVDCSTGGAQYGRGMYCAADYNGQLTQGIRNEMVHYQELGQQRNNTVAYTETLTLAPDARIISYNDIEQMRIDGVGDFWMAGNKDRAREIDRMDLGSYAALLGYDAINAEGHGESGSYTVILNRTAVIFRGE